MTKYIFVDVDGVLNYDSHEGGGFSHPIVLEGVTYKNIWLNKNHATMLLGLAERTGAQLVWATMWNDYANEFISPAIGLPELPVADVQQAYWNDTVAAMKARTVKKYAGDSVFVDFDDEYYIDQLIKDTNGKHIHIDPWYGLTQDHIDIAEKFLTQ
jgi:hypothetical protein